jgi:hypothetical protein
VKDKIGILTYHRSINYGAVMQAYSLSKRIAEDFPDYDIEIIDYVSERVELIYHQSFFNYCRHERIITDNELVLFEKIRGKYRVLIVGSDAVWNWQIRKFPSPYFLNADIGAVKMSYAASSYGQDYLKITDEQKTYIERAWSDFTYLGVRDNATERFVKYVNKELSPKHNCDPTVFLDISAIPVPDEEIRAIFIEAGVDLSKPVIGLMASDWLGKLVRKILGNRYQIVAIFKDNPYADFYLKDLSPFHWSKVFSYFSVTFTHFFHGNLLSLKNGTPTIIIENRTPYNATHNSKVRDLMTRLGLSDFCFYRDEIDGKENEILEAVKDRIHNRTNYQYRIFAGISQEALYYNDFKQALNEILNK